MKAAVFEGPGIMNYREVPLAICGEDDIVIKVGACGICGSDVRNFRFGLRGNVKSQIMGHEIAGTISAIGARVTGFNVGDHVAVAPDVSCGDCYYCRRGWVNLCINHKMIGTDWPGGFAEYCHLPSMVLDHGMVHHVPAGINLEDATLAEPAASVLAAQERAIIGIGDTVLVFGDGPVGCLHVEIARARGASTIILVGLTRIAEADRFEPDYLIDAASSDPVEEVARITNGFGADVAICANPVASTQEQAVEAVRKRGTIILFGGLPKETPITCLDSNRIHYNELSVVGAFSYPAFMHERALYAIRDGHIRPQKYFSLRVGLDKVGEGITAAAEGRVLKALVVPV